MLAVVLPWLAVAQQQEPRVEVFGGFSWLRIDTQGLDGPALDAITGAPAGTFDVRRNFYGWESALQINGNRWFGIKADISGHYRTPVISNDPANFPGLPRFNIYSFLFGPVISRRSERATLFVHALFGANRISSGDFEDPFNPPQTTSISNTAFAMALGGGLDVKLSKSVAWRLFQVDYLMTKHDPLEVFGLTGENQQNNIRVSTGVVFGFGGGPPPTPPSAACSANPTAVFAGEPVRVAATPRDFNPKHTLNYSWSATGGKVQGQGTSVTVDTAGLAPGSYTVRSTVTSAKRAKDTAPCSASFTVKERPKNPPTISCSANPGTVQSGTPSTITCNCSSPDNTPDYPVDTSITNWTASGGRLSGTGNTATLDTAGAPAGPISVTATCTDSRGLTAQGTATVNVEVPPAPPEASQINSIDFKRNNARVDNTAKAILDDVALRLQREADATAVVIGQADPGERGAAKLAADRARNTKAYLTKEKGIDPTRIETRTGNDGTMRADIWIVPAGATFTGEGTQVVP
jgi:outer membrane protein OmpA-like peptidoglycan-associated protein